MFSQYFYLLLYINRGISLHTQQSDTFHSEATAVALGLGIKCKMFNSHSTENIMTFEQNTSSNYTEIIPALPVFLVLACPLSASPAVLSTEEEDHRLIQQCFSPGSVSD